MKPESLAALGAVPLTDEQAAEIFGSEPANVSNINVAVGGVAVDIAEKAGRMVIDTLRSPKGRAEFIGAFGFSMFIMSRRPNIPFPALVVFAALGSYAGGQLYDMREDIKAIAQAARKAEDA